MTDQEQQVASSMLTDLNHAQASLNSLPPSSELVKRAGPALRNLIAFLKGEHGNIC